jgi:GTP:adenosylcobinamide-phosphate guanylyltransferase
MLPFYEQLANLKYYINKIKLKYKDDMSMPINEFNTNLDIIMSDITNIQKQFINLTNQPYDDILIERDYLREELKLTRTATINLINAFVKFLGDKNV